MIRSLVTLSFALVATSACAQKQKNATDTQQAGTPMQACKSIVEHAVNKDFQAVKAMSLRPEMPRKKMDKQGFNKMHDTQMASLKDLSCLREMIADDHAVVETESQGSKRLIPFVKQDQTWKFDPGAYMAFYDVKSNMQKKRK